MRILASVLFDLEKAFDKVPRDTTGAELRRLATDLGFDLVWQQMHDGTC